MSSILKVRDSTTGEWIDIPAIVGPKGEPGQSGVYFGKEEPTDENVNVWIRDANNNDNILNFVSYAPQTLTPEQQAQTRENIGAVAVPETAEVGQTIVVKEVDENGKPAQWEAADFPICGKTLVDFKLTEPVSEISIPLDDDMLQALQDAMFICLEIRPKGDETATDTTGFGKATCLLCGRPVFNDFEFIPSEETRDYPVSPYFMAQLAKFNMSEPYMLMNKITAVVSGMKVSQAYIYMPLISPKSHVLQLTGELPFGTNTHIQLYVH